LTLLLVKTTLAPLLQSFLLSSILLLPSSIPPPSLLSLPLVSYPFVPSSIPSRPDPFESAGQIRFWQLDRGEFRQLAITNGAEHPPLDGRLYEKDRKRKLLRRHQFDSTIIRKGARGSNIKVEYRNTLTGILAIPLLPLFLNAALRLVA
jgi:hypothetical protein